jgi:hypothetical protein
MALVDANGLVLPGITFTDNSGFVFPSEPSLVTLPGAQVPEPSAWATMLVGFAGLGFMRYRTGRTTVSV